MTPEVCRPLCICFVAPTMRDLNRVAFHLLRNNAKEIASFRRMAPQIMRFCDGTEVRFFSNGHVGHLDGYLFDQVFEVAGHGWIRPELETALRVQLTFSPVPEEFKWQFYNDDDFDEEEMRNEKRDPERTRRDPDHYQL